MIIDAQTGTTMATGLMRRIGRSIVRGDYEHKAFPCEADLAIFYQSSRTVTREAVKLLTSKGLISSRPRAGTKVEPVDKWNLLDEEVVLWLTESPFSQQIYSKFMQICQAIEPMGASLAAQFGEDGARIAAGEALNAMRAARQSSELVNAQVAFHLAVLRASNNPFFWRLKGLIEGTLRKSFEIAETTSYLDVSLYEAVYAGLAQKDGAQAELAMKWLLTSLATKIRQYEFDVTELPVAIC